jgi:hypothetical protein
MPWPQSASPDLHLERARDRVGRSRNAWCADYWRGECPVQGRWWRGSQKPNKPSKLHEIDENGEKTDGFTHVLAYKSPKTPFFAQKFLTRYTHEAFFEEYTNFQAHYLNHCWLIPLQSFGSHIRPQPHGLGLRTISIGQRDRCRLVICKGCSMSHTPACALAKTKDNVNLKSESASHAMFAYLPSSGYYKT